MNLDAVELRVLGCLLEKERTTPDQYPLSLNALRLAANQSTNREPVVDYDEGTIRAALDRLGSSGWTRLASGPSSRAAKFRHLLDDKLGLLPSQQALLTVLMLRGPQTVGELRVRSERLYPFSAAEDVEAGLTGLAERELAQRLPRRPGEREERWTHLLGDTVQEAPAPAPSSSGSLEARVDELERRLAALEARLSRAEPGTESGMSDEDELREQARESREATEKLREESEREMEEPSPGEPWAKTSSGDADSVTDDD